MKCSEPIPVAAGRPWENGHIESFYSRLRDEFLKRVEFESATDVKAKRAWIRREYNAVRPHCSLGYMTPRVVQRGLRWKQGERTDSFS